MADVTLSYKGSDILELSDSGSATLKTGGTYCEADIEVEYVKPSGGAKVLTKLGEYFVTEPVATISITATEQMQSCNILYIVADLVLSEADWIYPYINGIAGTGPTSMGYFDKYNHFQQSFCLAHLDEAKGATSRYTYIANLSVSYQRDSQLLSSINFKNYKSGVTYTSGTIEVWGYV